MTNIWPASYSLTPDEAFSCFQMHNRPPRSKPSNQKTWGQRGTTLICCSINQSQHVTNQRQWIGSALKLFVREQFSCRMNIFILNAQSRFHRRYYLSQILNNEMSLLLSAIELGFCLECGTWIKWKRSGENGCGSFGWEQIPVITGDVWVQTTSLIFMPMLKRESHGTHSQFITPE